MIKAVETDNLIEHVLQQLTRDHGTIVIKIGIRSVPRIVPKPAIGCLVAHCVCDAQIVLLARDGCLHRSDSGLHRCDSGLHRRYVIYQAAV